MLWRKLPGSERDVEQAAREVAATVLGHIQRAADAPEAFVPAAARTAGWQPAQAREPISYQEASRQIAGLQWVGGTAPFRLVDADGKPIEVENNVPRRSLRDNRRVPLEPQPRRPRRPARVLVRPGEGGLKRYAGSEIDPAEGLNNALDTYFGSEYESITWWRSTHGATLGLLTLDPEGDTAICCRLSVEDRGEYFSGQVHPTGALCRNAGLRVRHVLFAVHMSGTREVRHERASSPPQWVAERTDMLEVDEWIRDGWLRHIVVRDGDRIARDLVPGFMLLDRWRDNDIGLWIASLGRQIDYVADRQTLQMMMVVSEGERINVRRRLGMSALTKGPLAGNGHLGPTRFGLIRDKHTKRLHADPEQWPFILRAFELADSGLAGDGNGLSIRKLGEALAEEGCPFSFDRLRKILQDPIYATGEYTTYVHGVPIAQRPAELDNPVPLDRFQRVQGLLKTRKGKNSSTPLGEYLLNTVEAVHLQCEDVRNHRNQPALIKGWLRPKRSQERLYRHSIFTPECCKGTGRGAQGAFTWRRDELDRAIVRKVRELAQHPEVLKQLACAQRHEIAASNARLSDRQRRELEQELEGLEERIESETDAYVQRTINTPKLNGDAYRVFIGALTKRKQQLETRLRRDDELRARTADPDVQSVHEDRLQTFLELMTLDVPEDPLHRQVRARLFQQIVSRVLIDDDGTGPITITLEGHLVSEASPSFGDDNPVLHAADLLDAWRSHSSGKRPAAEAELARIEPKRSIQEEEEAGGGQVNTDLSALPDKSVLIYARYASLQRLPATRKLEQLRRQRLDATGWSFRQTATRRRLRRSVSPAWRYRFEIAQTFRLAGRGDASRGPRAPASFHDGFGSFADVTPCPSRPLE